MAEKEYIERGAALDTLLFEMSGTGCQSRAMDAVRFVPAADVVEVVRCKDCKYWDGMRFTGRCEAPMNGLIRDYTDCDDFCSYGERKAGNEKGAVNGSEEVPGENQEN